MPYLTNSKDFDAGKILKTSFQFAHQTVQHRVRPGNISGIPSFFRQPCLIAFWASLLLRMICEEFFWRCFNKQTIVPTGESTLSSLTTPPFTILLRVSNSFPMHTWTPPVKFRAFFSHQNAGEDHEKVSERMN
ncbi:hypothetical protein TNIN_315891 [Trichonephila inaurata madagascariensis]|uniref:Uncharacterized protein n=1 Tax=Trichonephila inaurata madagascariensis TaxID=2747483 RepID=A0A8X7CFU6_9ARAC|nr:hypothetical protein TNIN_315891 [Trichonephila inaurata madagascariensis]